MSNSTAPRFRGLPWVGRIHIVAVLGVAVAALGIATAAASGPRLDPALLAIPLALCAAGNLFEVFAPAHFSFQPNLVVFFAALLFVPPWAVAALAVASYLPGWVLHRFRWYMVAFNIANYTLAGLAAQAIISLGGPLGPGWTPDPGAIAALAAAAV